MDLTREYEKRRRFLEFLEANGLSPESVGRILEIAPDISLSISKLLVEKYGDLYKTFIASPKFKYHNEYGISGVRGEAWSFYKGLTFDVPKTSLNDQNLPRNLFTGKYKLPTERDFDTLLIYGQQRTQWRLYQSNLKKLYGLVFEGSMQDFYFSEESEYYSSIMTYLRYKKPDLYVYMQEYDSQRKETYVLINHKNHR